MHFCRIKEYSSSSKEKFNFKNLPLTFQYPLNGGLCLWPFLFQHLALFCNKRVLYASSSSHQSECPSSMHPLLQITTQWPLSHSKGSDKMQTWRMAQVALSRLGTRFLIGARSQRTCSWLQRLKQSTVKGGPEPSRGIYGTQIRGSCFLGLWVALSLWRSYKILDQYLKIYVNILLYLKLIWKKDTQIHAN